eukprot:TRINITY_DN26183_c0_g1_i1.p1 TRINITY_DN26183_c0_g1~~TRINITY_DN26183_c0_g1_i1.p1  ORF type:complete len:557 (-),score=95.04 TRINITY_DN26183_c0_g1_i1:349-2019(-)
MACELLPAPRRLIGDELLPLAASPRPNCRRKTDGETIGRSKTEGNAALDHWQLPRRMQGSARLLRQTFSRARASMIPTQCMTSLVDNSETQERSATAKAWEKARAVVVGSAAVLQQRAEACEKFEKVVVSAVEQKQEEKRQELLRKEFVDQLSAVLDEELTDEGVQSMKRIAEEVTALGHEDLGGKLRDVFSVVVGRGDLEQLQDMLLDQLAELDELQRIVASIMKEAEILKSLMGDRSDRPVVNMTFKEPQPAPRFLTAPMASPHRPSELPSLERKRRRAQTHNPLSALPKGPPKGAFAVPSDDDFVADEHPSSSEIRLNGRGLKRFQDIVNKVAPPPLPKLWHVVRDAMEQSPNAISPEIPNRPPSLNEEEEECAASEKDEEPWEDNVFPSDLIGWDEEIPVPVQASVHAISPAECNADSAVPSDFRGPPGELTGALRIKGWCIPSKALYATRPAKSSTQEIPYTLRRPSKENTEQRSRLVTLAALQAFPAIKPVYTKPPQVDAQAAGRSASLPRREIESFRSPRHSESETRSLPLTPRFRHLMPITPRSEDLQ